MPGPRHLFRTSAGLILIGVGVLGLILPLMPGIPFLVAGLAVLGTDHPVRTRIMGWLHRLRIMTKDPDDRPR
jgi:uncharacterized membrane protein YbaN (DUF454 family)